MNAIVQPDHELPLTKRLKSSTTSDHESVDHLVMSARPFESLERYGYFLRLQHRFHGAINAIYHDSALNKMLPGLAQLPRFDAVCADLTDLGMEVPAPPANVAIADSYAALGWLYCSEGSNLGAAFLYKETGQIGLDQQRGARHLAAHPDGRGLHWRQFASLLDSLPLGETQKLAACTGANAAFAYYRNALRETFPT